MWWLLWGSMDLWRLTSSHDLILAMNLHSYLHLCANTTFKKPFHSFSKESTFYLYQSLKLIYQINYLSWNQFTSQVVDSKSDQMILISISLSQSISYPNQCFIYTPLLHINIITDRSINQSIKSIPYPKFLNTSSNRNINQSISIFPILTFIQINQSISYSYQ